MNCREMKRHLPDYAEGEIAAARAAEIEAHLAVCAACRARLETLHGERHSVRRALQALPRIQASPDFERRVLEALPERMALPQRMVRPLSLFDRLDAVFARPVCKLLGSSVFGLLCGLLIVSLLAPRSLSAGDSPAPGDTTAPSVLAAVSEGTDEVAAIRQLRRLYALGRRSGAAEDDGLHWLHHVEKVGKQAPQEKPPRLQSLPRSNKKEPPWNAGILVSPSSSSSGSWC